MTKIQNPVPACVVLLTACLLVAGCSVPGLTGQTAQSGSTSTSPLFKAGDIVKNPKSLTSTAWLVIGYDSASGTYERAVVYPNADGSWGYRKDSRTEEVSREMMEDKYMQLLANIAPSSVPVVAQP